AAPARRPRRARRRPGTMRGGGALAHERRRAPVALRQPGRRRGGHTRLDAAKRRRRAAVRELPRRARRFAARRAARRLHHLPAGGSTMNTPAASDPLALLAEAAGIAVRWVDAHGRPQTVSAESLRAVLEALDLPAGTLALARDSLARLRQPAAAPALEVVDAGGRLPLPENRPRPY